MEWDSIVDKTVDALRKPWLTASGSQRANEAGTDEEGADEEGADEEGADEENTNEEGTDETKNCPLRYPRIAKCPLRYPRIVNTMIAETAAILKLENFILMKGKLMDQSQPQQIGLC